MATFRLPTKQFRSIPSPVGESKFGMFFTPAATMPADLWDWREVNPREVTRRSAVYKAMNQTLVTEPERFHERNRGITIVAEELTFDDKRQEVVIRLEDPALHGVADGGHTLDAVLEQKKNAPDGPWPANVFVKVITNVEPEQIPEIAGGLNTSQQVDLKSLENLRAHFDSLKLALKDESYADEIAYKMNDAKAVDVREILYYLVMFDRSTYNDKKHPVGLFGRKEGIVRDFAAQAEDPKRDDSFKILITRAPEILRLRDLIEKRALALPSIGRYKAGKRTRVRSESNRENHLVFLNEDVNGRIPLGWLLPMLAAYRANVEWNTPKGTFSWVVPIDELVEATIDTLVGAILDVHTSENHRPEYVGRNALAWRMCYGAVANAILERELVQARRKR